MKCALLPTWPLCDALAPPPCSASKAFWLKKNTTKVKWSRGSDILTLKTKSTVRFLTCSIVFRLFSVGSFIVSHLANLKSNPTPDKEEARRLVNKLKIDRTFRVDLRKYSRNYANTHFCNVNNAGWEVDANVIYSTDSFLPRSASFNLTLDLFGQSVNLLQVNHRPPPN